MVTLVVSLKGSIAGAARAGLIEIARWRLSSGLAGMSNRSSILGGEETA
jgi:hypothetical protein